MVYAADMEIDQLPELDRPNVIAAFQGWNDAGQGATTAVRYLIESWKAERFARIDPEEYFSFTDTRPHVKIVEGTQRELVWLSNEFFFYKGGERIQAAVLMIGTEPNLRWRSFCGEVVRLARSLGAQRLVTLGSLVTEAVHTRPVPLTGFSTDDAVQVKLVNRGIGRSSYEGPTGIVGTLHNICLHAGMPAASIWAAAPSCRRRASGPRRRSTSARPRTRRPRSACSTRSTRCWNFGSTSPICVSSRRSSRGR